MDCAGLPSAADKSGDRLWRLSHRADPSARRIADRHYSRQSIGAKQFVPPGRCLVLVRDDAYWVSSWPYAEYVKHAWAGLVVCSAFRNEGDVLSSTLIRHALACTRWKWPDLPSGGMVTFVNEDKVRRKRDPGRCFRRAGFSVAGRTKGGLLALTIPLDEWPDESVPCGAQTTLPVAVA